MFITRLNLWNDGILHIWNVLYTEFLCSSQYHLAFTSSVLDFWPCTWLWGPTLSFVVLQYRFTQILQYQFCKISYKNTVLIKYQISLKIPIFPFPQPNSSPLSQWPNHTKLLPNSWLTLDAQCSYNSWTYFPNYHLKDSWVMLLDLLSFLSQRIRKSSVWFLKVYHSKWNFWASLWHTTCSWH